MFPFLIDRMYTLAPLTLSEQKLEEEEILFVALKFSLCDLL